MYLRPKTKRRLLILGTAFSMIAAVLLTGYIVRARRIGRQIADARTRAMSANAVGDHQAALEAFRYYLDETKTADKPPTEADAEAVLAYAKSRAAVESDKGRHLFEAVKILERYMRLRPTDAEARRMLLELEPRIGYNDEALQLADATLAETPDDADALRARVHALRNKGTQDRQFYTQALAAAEHLAKVRPEDLRAQVEVLRLMAATKRPDADIVARARTLKAAHTNDPRFDLLLATACLLTREPEPAAAALKAAAEAKAIPDPTFAIELARQLEAFSMFPLAQDVIERGAAAFPADADLARAAAWRLWQAGRHDEVLTRLGNIDPEKADATLVALRAMSSAAVAADHRGDAPSAQQTLACRRSDAAAAAWSTVLTAHLGDAGSDMGKLAALYRSAIERDPQNPIAPLLLGDAYAHMGEAELAGDAWRSTARLAPSWATPYGRLARAAIDAGNYADAARFAEGAYRRAPGDLAIAGDWVVASYGLLQTKPGGDPTAAAAELLKTAEAVQKDVPGEPRTLPVYVALLAESGRKDDAVKAARSALGAPKPDADLVTRLAVVNRTHNLGLDSEVNQPAATEQQSPVAAFRAAALLLQAGKTAEALEAMSAAKTRAAASGVSSLPWDVAALELLDLAGDESTAADWAKLGDANPKDLAVQSAVLRSQARGRDRELWKRAIARVKEMTGPEAHLWQIEQARLSLAGNAGSDELSAAIALLEGVAKSTATSPEPRRLLALAYERRSRERGGEERRAALARAIEEIGKAADFRPGDATITRDLVAIYRAAGQNEQAVQFLDRFALDGSGKLDAQSRTWVADAYSELGEFQKAASLLEGANDGASVARLAALRRRQGDPQAAALLYRRLLQRGDADAPMLIEAAEFFADRGDITTAQQFITTLATLPLRPGGLELVRGRFQDRRGKFDEALSAYRAATSIQGAGPNAWHELAGFLLRQRRFPEAAAAATEGLKSAPKDEWLAAMIARATTLKSALEAAPPRANAEDPSVDALLVALSTNPSDEAAVQMLEMLSKVTGPTLETVRPLADRFPQFMPLQYRAIRLALGARQFPAAEQLARRAARNRPDDPEAARLLAAALAAQGEWTKAKPAALAWRALAWNNPLPADLLAAESDIECGDPSAAVERLTGYVTGTARDDVRVNTMQARALIESARAEDAAALLEARASRERAWRAAWLSLATAHRDATAASSWIGRIAPRVSQTEPAERKSLAEAWLAVGQRFGGTDAYRMGFDVIRALPPGSLDADAQAVLALCAQAVGDYDAAVAAHRAVLAANPKLPEAKNNLAYALMLRGKSDDLSEAKRLADEAVAVKSDNATFRDTLARIDVRAGNHDAGAAEFRAALRLEPYHLEARLGLVDILASTRQQDEGRILLASLEKDLKLAPAALPPHLTGQLESVRKALAKP